MQLLDAHQLDLEVRGRIGVDAAVENPVGETQLAGRIVAVKGVVADEGEVVHARGLRIGGVTKGTADQVFDALERVEPRAQRVLLRRGRQRHGDPRLSAAVGDRVVTVTSIQHVVADAGEQHVIQRVADTVGRIAAVQVQVLDVAAQGEGRQGAVHAVDAARDTIGVGFDHAVAAVVDVVSVVAVAAAHAVGPACAVDDVGCRVTGDEVAQVVAVAVDGGNARQYQVLQIRAEGPADRRLHGVDLRSTEDHAAFVLRAVEDCLHAVVVARVAMEAQVIGDVVSQTLADDLGGLFVQVPDVVRVNQWVDLMAQWQVGVIHRQLDVVALGGNRLLRGADIANALNDAGDFFFRETASARRILVVVTGFHHVHVEVAELGVQGDGTQQGRARLVDIGQPPAQLQFFGAKGGHAVDRAAAHCNVDPVAVGVVELTAHVVGGVLAQAVHQHGGAGLAVIFGHAQQTRIGLAEGWQEQDLLIGPGAKHEIVGGQGIEVVAAQGDLEAMTVSVGLAGFDVRLVASGVQAQVQRAVAAVTQTEEAQAGHIDLVYAVSKVVDRVGGRDAAGAVVAIAVLDAGVAEGVGAFAAVQRVTSQAAVDDVVPGAGANSVAATQAQDQRVSARRSAGRRAAEGQQRAVEGQPVGQGAAIGQGCGIAQRVVIAVGKAVAGDGVRERRVFGGVLVEQRYHHHGCDVNRHVLVGKDEMAGIETAGQVAGQGQLKTVAVGVGHAVLDVRAVVAGVDLIADAAGGGAIAVLGRGEAEHVRTRATGQFVCAGTADDDVVAVTAIEYVVARAPEQLIVARSAREGVVTRRAVDYARGQRDVLHCEGEAVADHGVAGIACGDLDRVGARSRVARCAAERARGGIERQPGRQGGAVFQGRGVAQVVVVRVGKAGARYHVAERRVFGGVLIQQWIGDHRCLVDRRRGGEDEIGAGQLVDIIARERNLEPVAVRIGRQRLDVGLVASVVEDRIHGVVHAVGQRGEAQLGQVDLVGGDIKIGDQITQVSAAFIVVAVAVEPAGEGERVSARSAAQGVLTGAAVQAIIAAAARQAVVARQAQKCVLALGALQRIVVGGAGEGAVEDEIVGGERADQVARKNQLEPVAVGVGVVILDVGAVVARAVADLQGAATAVAQTGEAQVGEVDLVLGRVEVGDGVIEAGGRVAIAVRFAGEAEDVCARAAAELVDAGAADHDVITRATVDGVIAGRAVENLVGIGAQQGVVAIGALNRDDRHGVADVAAVAVYQGVALGGVADGVADDGVAISTVFVALGDAVGGQRAAIDGVALDRVVAAVEIFAGNALGVVVGLNDDFRHAATQGVVAQGVVDDVDVVAAVDAHAGAAVVVDVDAGEGDAAGQFDQHAFCAIVIHLATGDGDVIGRGDVLAATLHNDSAAAVAIGNVIAEGEVVGAGHDVEAVTVVVVGDVVFEGAVAQEVGNKTVQAIAVGHAVLDDHVDGLFMRVETVTGAVLDFDAVQRDVGVVAFLARNETVEPAIDLAGGVVPVAVDGQVAEAEVVGFFAIGGADDAGDFGVGAVGHFDVRNAHAVAVHVDVAFEHETTVRRFFAARHDVGPGRYVHLSSAGRRGCINRLLNRRGVVRDAISFGAKILDVKNHVLISGSRLWSYCVPISNRLAPQVFDELRVRFSGTASGFGLINWPVQLRRARFCRSALAREGVNAVDGGVCGCWRKGSGYHRCSVCPGGVLAFTAAAPDTAGSPASRLLQWDRVHPTGPPFRVRRTHQVTRSHWGHVRIGVACALFVGPASAGKALAGAIDDQATSAGAQRRQSRPSRLAAYKALSAMAISASALICGALATATPRLMVTLAPAPSAGWGTLSADTAERRFSASARA
nr:hypothetical protein [Tanacetum cinerariifolium]